MIHDRRTRVRNDGHFSISAHVRAADEHLKLFWLFSVRFVVGQDCATEDWIVESIREPIKKVVGKRWDL